MCMLTVTAFCVLFLLFLSGGHGELLSASIGVTAYGSVNMSSCVCFMYTSIASAGMSVAGCIGNRAKSQCRPSCFFQEIHLPLSLSAGCRTKCAVKPSATCRQPPLACLSGHKITPLFRVSYTSPFLSHHALLPYGFRAFCVSERIYDGKSGLRCPA